MNKYLDFLKNESDFIFFGTPKINEFLVNSLSKDRVIFNMDFLNVNFFYRSLISKFFLDIEVLNNLKMQEYFLNEYDLILVDEIVKLQDEVVEHEYLLDFNYDVFLEIKNQRFIISDAFLLNAKDLKIIEILKFNNEVIYLYDDHYLASSNIEFINIKPVVNEELDYKFIAYECNNIFVEFDLLVGFLFKENNVQILFDDISKYPILVSVLLKNGIGFNTEYAVSLKNTKYFSNIYEAFKNVNSYDCLSLIIENLKVPNIIKEALIIFSLDFIDVKNSFNYLFLKNLENVSFKEKYESSNNIKISKYLDYDYQYTKIFCLHFNEDSFLRPTKASKLLSNELNDVYYESSKILKKRILDVSSKVFYSSANSKGEALNIPIEIKNPIYVNTDFVFKNNLSFFYLKPFELSLNSQYRNEVLNITNMYLLEKMVEFSSSKIETYYKCNYQFYLKYILNIKEKQKNVQISGIMKHFVLENISLYLIKENIKLINVKDDVLDVLIINSLESFFEQRKDFLNKEILIFYFHERMFELVKLYQKMDSKNLFLAYSAEENMKIALDEYLIVGKIDNIDKYENYYRIIDYKSSLKKIKYDEFIKGVQIQLPTYLYFLYKKYQTITGAHYLNMKFNFQKISTIKQEKKYSEFKLSGLILDDLNVIKKYDIDFLEESEILNVRVRKDGEFHFNSQIISSENVLTLFSQLEEIYVNTANLINSGCFKIEPIDSACQYCSFRNICKFDLRYNKYNENEIVEDLKLF